MMDPKEKLAAIKRQTDDAARVLFRLDARIGRREALKVLSDRARASTGTEQYAAVVCYLAVLNSELYSDFEDDRF